MFTSKCIKEKLQFSEFINGLEKGHVSSWKAGLKNASHVSRDNTS